MNTLELVGSIGKIITFLMLLFSFFLFTVGGEKKLANRIFALFLLITALDISGLFLDSFFVGHLNFRALKAASTLLQMPLYFLYVRAVCYTDFKLNPVHTAHGVLFLLFVLVLKITTFSQPALTAFRLVGEVQYFGYILAVFHTLKRYKTHYLEHYSKTDRSGYRWLFQMTVFFCAAHVFVLLKMGALFLDGDPDMLMLLYLVISLTALVIICWFVLTALHRPHLFTGIQSGLDPGHSIYASKKGKPVQHAGAQEAVAIILQFMERERPYLDFELTLEKLAGQLQMPEKELSLLINHHLGKHFFDFINQYRIEMAKELLGNPEYRNLTILEILYRVGFNSKSSFYDAFKKATHQTPTAYRKAALS